MTSPLELEKELRRRLATFSQAQSFDCVSVATLLDTIDALRNEQDEARRLHRWVLTEAPDGSLVVCRGEHAKSDDCEYETFVPKERLATVEREAIERVADAVAFVFPQQPEIAAAIRALQPQEGKR